MTRAIIDCQVILMVKARNGPILVRLFQAGRRRALITIFMVLSSNGHYGNLSRSRAINGGAAIMFLRLISSNRYHVLLRIM